MTHPGSDLNRRWLGLVLVAMTAVLIMLLGAGTALAATAPEVEAVGDGHHTEGQSVLGWHDGRPTCNSGLATGVVAENSLVKSARIALTNRYDGAEPIYDTSVLFVDARTVVQVEPVGRPSAVPLGMQVRTASEGSVAVSGFVVAAKTGGAAAVRIGQAGESAVRGAYDIGPKAAAEIGGRGRIFDGLNADAVSEVKTVARQSFTRQLHDDVDYATANSLRFDLYVRPSTRLSGPMLRADLDPFNPLNIRYIP